MSSSDNKKFMDELAQEIRIKQDESKKFKKIYQDRADLINLEVA